MDKYDAVIIGGGIGGLTCALLLAKKGAHVAVFEKEKRPGGYCTSFSTDGYLFDACIASIGGLRKNEPLRRIVEDDLGVWGKVEFDELNPVQRNLFPDFSIDIPADVNQYKDALSKIFPAEQEGIKKTLSLMEEIHVSSLRAMCNTSDSEVLADYLDKSLYDLLSSYISDEKLKAVLSSYCTFLGVSSHDASAVATSNIMMHYVKGGAFRVRGGIQKLSDVLVSEIRNCGSEFFLEEEVVRILCNGVQATGVVTKNGKKVVATHIISNIDVKTAFSLMESRILDEGKTKKINELETSGSLVLAYLGVEDDLSSFGLASVMGYFSSYDFDGMLNMNNHMSFGVTFPSLFDKSLVPKGCGNVVIHCPFCYTGNSKVVNKDEVGKALVDELGKIMPGITDRVVYQSIAGPDTLQRYSGNSFGAAYGWKQDANFLKNLPFLRNLVDNFHLVGHWAGYGGGVMPSIFSAYKVAKDITR